MRRAFAVAAFAGVSIVAVTAGALMQEFMPVADRMIGALDMAKVPLWLGLGGMGAAAVESAMGLSKSLFSRSP